MLSRTRIHQQGFTLIELMIVVAIIGILSAVAIPAYQDYTKRAHVSEGLNMASGVKAAVTEYYASEGTWPTSNESAGLDNTLQGNAVTSVSVQNDGSILITYNIKVASGAQLLLQPSYSNGAIQWKCARVTTSTMKAKFLPSNCRNHTATPSP
ncbi:MAG: prepilin-type N-terminal cleavage/methylation domain-containing protein [Oceanospirillales bacterium LUC14_002_19_P2]|nr:MAG: prepilin-type N-terminal cleavage/methylation domain-containing protein [Oceanospirillales bacterium LUC14_002_19_P2]